MQERLAADAEGDLRGLQPQRIIETIARLEARITERFPGSGLGRVSGELYRVAGESTALWERLRLPYWPIRLLASAGILLIVVVAVGIGQQLLAGSAQLKGLSDFQTIESAINDVILFSLAAYLLWSLEGRFKRRIALRNLHRLRSIMHIVDMHQLTKDPESLFGPAGATPSSPQRDMPRPLLARYLDYCTELLSLTSKIAAMHVQYLNDPVVLNAVNDIETLAASLSNGIWQKIMILDKQLVEE